MMNKILLSIFLCILCGCSTAITYSKGDGADQLESTALKFQLQDSSLTLAVAGAEAKSSAAPTSNCPKDVVDTWWKCFNRVAPHAARAPSASNQIYVAKPADYQHLYFSTTTISGVAVTGQDALYNSVTITYTNNTSTIIAGAAAGAVSGFGIAGPPGAVVGLVVGGAVAGIPKGGMLTAPFGLTPPLKIEDYICENEPVDLSLARATALKPSLYLPLTINAADARPIAREEKLTLPQNDETNSCWHTLPNTGHLGEVTPVFAGTSDTSLKPRKPIDGDGWLYRVVAVDGKDPSQPPKGAMRTDEYFNSSGVRQDFPYSACRNVTLQVTWWKDLADAIKRVNENKENKNDPLLRVVTFKTVIADPDYVFQAKVKKGGVINFKPDCGANVSMTADHSYNATINALIKATQDIYKAEQTWSNSQKK